MDEQHTEPLSDEQHARVYEAWAAWEQAAHIIETQEVAA
jgi:hypothetical protein